MTLTIILSVIAVIFIALNWEGKVNYIATVKAHTPFAGGQGLPYTYEEVLNKYFDQLDWKVREESGIHYVDINGTVKEIDSKFALTIRVSPNPDDPNSVFMDPVSVILGDRQSATEDEAAGVIYNLFCMYDEGYEIDAESEYTGINEDFYAEYEEAARPVIIDWFERHPLRENIRVQFMSEIANAGEGKYGYLVYEMYSISGEEYGIFYVNPENGDMMMDSLMDSSGKWLSIQVPMDQWYLEYYWGMTDDSGYYSKLYMDDTYIIYDGEGYEMLEYSASHDSYVICDFDGLSFIQYDDNSVASEIDILDFAGIYGYDGSFEVDGTFVNFYYSLEISEWNGYNFSIAETWRGNAVLQDEWARPKRLVVNTLTFDIWNPDMGYETHSLTYVPAKNSPLGQDVIYIDGDDTMPFIRK